MGGLFARDEMLKQLSELKKENEKLKLYKDLKKKNWLNSCATIDLKKELEELRDENQGNFKDIEDLKAELTSLKEASVLVYKKFKNIKKENKVLKVYHENVIEELKSKDSAGEEISFKDIAECVGYVEQ
tara:strand:- start:238 stop:624 length:387 start_codon:yes stop_codon:yes gene_type:complete